MIRSSKLRRVLIRRSYSEVHRHFISDDLPPLLKDEVRAGEIADIGCGDGRILYALEKRGLLERGYAIDNSADRATRTAALSNRIEAKVADAVATGLPDSSVDGVIASQLIEHLPDDRLLAGEIARILRPGGWYYVGSVARSTHAFWFYRRNGRSVLDPTHLREYSSLAEMERSLENAMLRVHSRRQAPMRYPLVELGARALAVTRVISYEALPSLYLKRPLLRRTRSLTLRAPGYSLIEVFGTKIV